MHKISVVIITLNEADIIERCLRSLQWCDEIIVIDSGSSDQTVRICEQFGAKVFYKDFNGFGEQKRYAVEKATNNWILSVDADEVLTETLKEEIQRVLKKTNIEYHGYHMPRSLFFLGKKIFSERKRPCLRLFQKKYGHFTNEKVHEKVEISGKVGNLENELLHYSYKNISDYWVKFNRYTSLAAQKLIEKKTKKSKLEIMFRAPLEFIKIYLFRGAFLSGFAGFIWAFFSSVYPVVKYTKVLEHEIKDKI